MKMGLGVYADFKPFQKDGFIGIGKYDLPLNELENVRGDSWGGKRIADFYFKPLKSGELNDLPVKRFENNVLLYRNLNERYFDAGVPEPAGVIYRGGLEHLLSGKFDEAHYVSKFMDGRCLFGLITDSEDVVLSSRFAKAVTQPLETGIVLLDIAPRDIIVSYRGDVANFYFCDNEDVVLNGDHKKQIELQREIIEKEYLELPNGREFLEAYDRYLASMKKDDKLKRFENKIIGKP